MRVLKENLAYYLGLYNTWSSYAPETNGTLIAYASVYGNTARASKELYNELKRRGVACEIIDLTRCDIKEAVSLAFKYSALALASVTYNAGVFPCMREFINELLDRGYNSRKVGFIENGSWAPMSAKVMRGMLEGAKNLTLCEASVKITSAVNSEALSAIKALADELSN